MNLKGGDFMNKFIGVEKDVMQVLAKKTDLIIQINDSFEKALDSTISKEERTKYINEVVTNTVSLSIVSTIETISEAISNHDQSQ